MRQSVRRKYPSDDHTQTRLERTAAAVCRKLQECRGTWSSGGCHSQSNAARENTPAPSIVTTRPRVAQTGKVIECGVPASRRSLSLTSLQMYGVQMGTRHELHGCVLTRYRHWSRIPGPAQILNTSATLHGGCTPVQVGVNELLVPTAVDGPAMSLDLLDLTYVRGPC